MMCGCWPRYWVTIMRAMSSAVSRSSCTLHTTSCGRSMSSMLRPALAAPVAKASIARWL